MAKKPALISARLFDLFKNENFQDFFLISPTSVWSAFGLCRINNPLTGRLGLFDNASAS